jgi:thiosulfate/3-mercaptopyruvate sulfurtransferase
MKHIVTTEWLGERLSSGLHENSVEHREGSLVLVDCRFVLGKPNAGLEAYEVGTIPGAYYFDLEQDLSGPVQEHGGRHPLPDFNALADKMEMAGVDRGSIVVAFDEQGGAMASRLWWLLRYMGHEQVYVLDGGFPKWKSEGRAVKMPNPPTYPPTHSPTHSPTYLSTHSPTHSPMHPPKRKFSMQLQPQMVASMEEVKAKIDVDSSVLIDSREAVRYLGLEEPIDKAAGHIPGALNYFWKDSLGAGGKWKSDQEQKERFVGMQTSKETIVYCGSGVTACPNILALAEAGFTQVKLYPGSWSDWISYEENPIATGEE